MSESIHVNRIAEFLETPLASSQAPATPSLKAQTHSKAAWRCKGCRRREAPSRRLPTLPFPMPVRRRARLAHVAGRDDRLCPGCPASDR
jgi:hypothetical protein